MTWLEERRNELVILADVFARGGLAEKALAAYDAHAKNALETRRRGEIRAWLVQRGRG